MEKLQPPW
jgi:hypothetical protein